MARPLRIQLPGLCYHVHSRGNGRMTIYLDDCDKEQFLVQLAEVAERFRLACHAFCLMGNHYHLVITTRDPNLSSAIHALNGQYAQWWNRRHARVGHVFQGRFGAKVVQEDVYLLTVCKYVVLNPVRKGLVDSPDQWRWSSYRASAGLERLSAFLQLEMLWEVLGDGDFETNALRYRRFIAAPDHDARKVMRLPIIGDPEFVKRFDEFRRRASPEVPRRERQVRPSLEVLFRGAVTRAERNAHSASAHAAGYSIAAIARYLGLHHTTVSKMIAPVAGVRREKTDSFRPDPKTVKKPTVSDLTPKA